MAIGIAALFGMLALVMLGVPLAFALLGVSFVAVYFLSGPSFALMLFTDLPRQVLANYSYSVVPMFILMGQLAGELGLAAHGYTAARRWLSFSRGGVLSATFGAGALFAAISGSSVASAGFFAKVAIPELEKYGYNKSLGLGAVAAAGTLATLIPPSVMMVIFAMMTGVSVGGLLLGGIVPGIVLTSLFIGFLEIVGRLRPNLLPPVIESITMRSRIASLQKIYPIVLTFLLMFGGIYFGFFTPTAGGAIGAVIVLVIGLIQGMKARQIGSSIKESMLVTSQLFFVVFGGIMFSKMIALSGMVSVLISAVGGLPGVAIVATVILIYLVAGAVLDPVSMVVIGVPFTFPLMLNLGFQDIQVGIMVILLVEIAVLTPPVGFNCYIVASSAKVKPDVVFRGIIPFFIILLGMIALILAVPQLSTWLPNNMMR